MSPRSLKPDLPDIFNGLMKNYGGNSIAGAFRRHSRKWTASPLLNHPGLSFGKVTLATDVFYHKILYEAPRGGLFIKTHSKGGRGA